MGKDNSVYDAIRSMPLQLGAEQCAWCLGIGLSTWHRYVKEGLVKPGVKMGPKSRRWPKAYIIELMQHGIGTAPPPPSVPSRAEQRI